MKKFSLLYLDILIYINLSHVLPAQPLLIFGGHKFFCGATDTPVFGLLDMSLQGFKARVGSLIHTQQTCIHVLHHEIHLRCDTCRTLGGHQGSQAVLFHIPASAYCKVLMIDKMSTKGTF